MAASSNGRINVANAAFIDDHPFLDRSQRSTDEIVKAYFERFYTNLEISNALAIGHDIYLSVSTVKRILKRLGLRRRSDISTSLEEIVDTIMKELEGSGSCLGYRTMWKRLTTIHHLKVNRDTVMSAMRIIDPDGVYRRKKHRLQRRKYTNPGPNYIWHIDGYDKLKPFGFTIHGCIDGFSRRILWLEIGPSNNNPYVIASYYLKCLKRLSVTSRIIRADHGTENQVVNFLQTYFRFNGEDRNRGLKSFIFGKSSSNQRIESWWSILRKQHTDYWIQFFKDLRDSDVYDETDPLHRDCLRFCFTKLLRNGLNHVASQWNQHRLQVKKQSEGLRGIPDILYFFPESINSRSYGTAVSDADITACQELYANHLPNAFGCSDSFVEIVDLIKPNCQEPQTTIQALDLFKELLALLNEELQ